MGNFIALVFDVVEWIGKCIINVVNWFNQFLNYVSNIVRSFIFGIEDTIRRADNPRKFGEAAAIRKERGELDKKAKELYGGLSLHDQQLLDQCFS